MNRGLLVKVAGVVVAYGIYVVAAGHLAAEDPIGEVLLGRAGSVFPVAALVLVLRIALIVFLPAIAARGIVRMVLDGRKKDSVEAKGEGEGEPEADSVE